MRVAFRYERFQQIYPTCIEATCVYIDPGDSTLCISDGIDWWEGDLDLVQAYPKLVDAFECGYLNFLREPPIFRICK